MTPPPKTRAERLIMDLGLNWSPKRRERFLSRVKTVYVKRLKEPYPLDGYFTAATSKAKRQWKTYWEGKRVQEPWRNKGQRREIVGFHPSRLQYVIQPEESAVFRDADTGEIVLVVLRNFVPDEDIRESMVDICKEIIPTRIDARRDDPGMLVHFGYTCGSRTIGLTRLAASKARLDSVAAVKREKNINAKAQGMAGIVWNLMKSRLPPEITADFNDMIEKYNLPRMNMQRKDTDFTFKVDGEDITFHTGENGLELPPPTAMSAINYARHTHTEINGNNWVVAITAHAPEDPTKGGNFYQASYGIMMLPATNTASAWNARDHHGTTLYEMKEGEGGRAGSELREDGDFNTGMVFEIPKGFKTACARSPWLNKQPQGEPVMLSSDEDESETSDDALENTPVLRTTKSNGGKLSPPKPKPKPRPSPRREAKLERRAKMMMRQPSSDSEYVPPD
ncbi:hypothetical protein F5Y04DRAFT_189981 [Hypomontagnella monticulosa]|nr:hypothetical protein F5Y04DRAFT_189981 [Hypomontagnella monticulosa]